MFQFSKILFLLRRNIPRLIVFGFLACILAVTWFFLKTKKSFPEEIHIAIQEEFQRTIKKKLLKNNPLITSVKFHELWTETTGESSQIKAVFSYSFNDPSSSDSDVGVTVTGSALLNRQEDRQKDASEKWEISSFDVDQTEINFNNELLIISPLEEATQKKSPEVEPLPESLDEGS